MSFIFVRRGIRIRNSNLLGFNQIILRWEEGLLWLRQFSINNLINFKEKYYLHHPQKEIVDACKFAEAELKSSLNLENCLKKLYFEKKHSKSCEPLYI